MKTIQDVSDMFDQFGGEAECKAKYPATYAAIMKTASSQKEPLMFTSAPNEQEISLQLLSVEQKHTDVSKINLLMNCFMRGNYKKGYLLFEVRAKQKSTGNVICKKEEKIWYQENSEEYGVTLELEIDSKYGKDCEVILIGGPVTNDGAVLSSESFDLSRYNAAPNSYSIQDPRKKVSLDPDSINFFFGYGPRLEESKVDYLYRGNKDGIPDSQLRVPSKGSACTDLSLKRIERASLYLTSKTENATKEVHYDNIIEKISLTDNGIMWEGIDDWGKNISVIKSGIGNLIGYVLSVTCSLNKSSDLHTFRIVNTGSYTNLLPIRFYWDCLAKGTLITMADGSEKPIENVRVGEKVKTLDGTNIVRDIVKRKEDEAMIVIKTEKGKEIKSTLSHPFMTVDGPIPANYISSGTELRTENGTCKVITACAEFFGICDVYNLILDKKGVMFFANGAASGDFNMQSTLPKEIARSFIAPEWLTDYDNFMISKNA